MTSPAQPDLSKLRINRDAPPPSLSRAVRRNVILGVVALIVLIGAFLGWRRGSVVTVETVVAKPLAAGGSADNAGSSSVTANGYVVARTRASVSAKLPGRIAELRVSEGSTLKKHEIIATLENADYQAQLAQAQAAEATARADLMEARASLATASRDAKRLRDIRTQDSKAVAEQDFDAAQGRESEAQARVQAAEARIGSARAAAGFARANLENTVIRAPFNGTVLRKEAEVGEVVAPSVGGGLTRGAVVTMADLTTLEVEVDVNEAYIARVTGGQPAKITLDAYPDTSFRGRVRQVVPTADRQRATVQVKVAIVDRDPRILPEMGARVDFLDTTHVGKPEPHRAGHRGSGFPQQRCASSMARASSGWCGTGGWSRAQVDAGPVSGGFREIRSGLSGGELLLTGGVDEPKAGMRVKTEVKQSR